MTIELSKPDSRLEAIQFLAKSMLPKDGRFHLGHVKVEANGNAVSTDGSRMHFVENLPLEPGYYKVHKCTKSGALIDKIFELDTTEGSFPDYADILTIPNGNGEKSFDVVLSTSDNQPSKTYSEIVRAMSGNVVNFNFVNDLCNVIDDTVSVIVPAPDNMGKNESFTGETCKPIHFVKNGYHAVIMPIQV